VGNQVSTIGKTTNTEHGEANLRMKRAYICSQKSGSTWF